MKSGSLFRRLILLVSLIIITACGKTDKENKPIRELLNVSYDPTREMYQEFNEAFIKHWKERTGETVTIRQSHGGSGKQARSVIDGLEADVVTLALAYDIDAIADKSGFISDEWQKRLPGNSCPYTSTMVFLVRKGNPKNIKDWDDLIRNDISVITPNPKTSGAARWNYLAAWAFALEKYNDDEEKVMDFMKKLFKNVPVLDSGARGSTNTFVQRELGDVLLAWENEALLVVNSIGKGNYEIVTPSVSILAEPPVTVVDKFAKQKGNNELAEEYLKFLYTESGQEIISKHYYRPSNPKILEKYKDQYPHLKLITIQESFNDWKTAQTVHFNDGGTFDKIYSEINNE